MAGVDDPHIGHDDYDRIAGPPDPEDRGGDDAGPVLRLGLTHSPEPRVLDGFAADGYDLVLAGHTHGGQLRLPGYGAVVTNCGVDRSRARGASRWGSHLRLHVSAGLGTSPYAPVRFGCRPEASLLELRPPRGRGPGGSAAGRHLGRAPAPVQPGRHHQVGSSSEQMSAAQLLGVWRSLVARLVRDEEAVGSNPATPTTRPRSDRTGAFVVPGPGPRGGM